MKLKSGIFGLLAAALLASCSTGNDVVSGRGIQKRKYNDGYYISLGKKYNKTDKVSKEESITEAEKKSETYTIPESAPEVISANPAPVSEGVETTPAGVTTTTTNSNPAPSDESNSTQADEGTTANETKEKTNDTFEPGRIYAPKLIQTVVSQNVAGASGIMLVVLVILCLIVPPLAVFIFEGASQRFWIDLILFIIGIAVVGWLLNGISGLALLVSVIFALLIVLSVI